MAWHRPATSHYPFVHCVWISLYIFETEQSHLWTCEYYIDVDHIGVSNHWLLNSTVCSTGDRWVTDGFPSQKASNAASVGPMLVQRWHTTIGITLCQRWPNVSGPMLGRCWHNVGPTLACNRWANVGPIDKSTLAQRWWVDVGPT